MTREEGFYRINLSEPGRQPDSNLWRFGWWNDYAKRFKCQDRNYREDELAAVEPDLVDPRPSHVVEMLTSAS